MLRLDGYRWSGRLTIRTEQLHLCAAFSETLPSMVAASRPRPLEGILESTRDWKTIGIHFVSELSEAPCLGRDERDKLLKALGSIAEISELTNVKKVTISQMLVRT